MTDRDNPLKTKFSDQISRTRQDLTKTEGNQTRNWSNHKEGEKPNSLFGIERSNRFVRRFKVLFRDGRIMSMPYAHLPLFVFDPTGKLFVQTSEVIIVIKGRALNKLTDWFNEEKILWVKESPSGTDIEDEDVFIESIVLKTDDDV